MIGLEVNENKRIWNILKLMTPEIKKRKCLEAWDQSEIFRHTQNMRVYFVMLMGHRYQENSHPENSHQSNSPPGESPPPGKFPFTKFPPGKFPPMFLNIPTHVIYLFFCLLMSPLSLLLVKFDNWSLLYSTCWFWMFLSLKLFMKNVTLLNSINFI